MYCPDCAKSERTIVELEIDVRAMDAENRHLKAQLALYQACVEAADELRKQWPDSPSSDNYDLARSKLPTSPTKEG